MKKIITAFIFCFLCGECFSQAGEWVWIKGDSTQGNLATYGIQGVPSPTNNPPALYEPCEWTDLSGNFWLCGGFWTNGNGSTGYIYGDLWKYNISTNEWTWMKGSGLPDDSGHYGIQGIPSPNNYPSARLRGAASWTDNQGNLWMFGGDFLGSRSDLWKYTISTNEWTWIKGDSIPNQHGNYGVQGIPSIFNNPRCREEAATSWTDNSGDLWLYGGADFSTGGGFLNDLWRYNISTNEWTWMKGDSLINRPAILGTQGIENSNNIPHSRAVYSHWKDNTGKFWMFGGVYWYAMYNDLWRYNPSTNNWAWMGGDTIPNTFGSYGAKCVSSSANLPSSRYENRACWKDQYGNFWTFGGGNSSTSLDSVRNDLWMYCVATSKWIWINGNTNFNPGGNWGTIGVSSPNNRPNGRGGSVGWTDNNGHLYLFGGARLGAIYYDMYNDLWKYTIDTACTQCNINVGIENSNLSQQAIEIFPNPANSSFTISFSSSEKQSVELRIYNTLGQLQLFQSFETLENVFSKEIHVEKWSDGIYFLQVKMKEGVVSKKVVVQH
jgi:hypothetical protein